MKTHVIPLEPFDDLASVRDKMAWGKTTRILIIWPENGEPILDRRLDILLLKRRADELGAQLAFVVRDPQVRSLARQLAIPVYRSPRQAQTSRWRTRRRLDPLVLARRTRAAQGPKFTLPQTPAAQPVSPSVRVWHTLFRVPLFILALISVAALAGLLFPRASITLTPAVKTQSVTFTAFTSPTITTANAAGAIPAQAITVIVEGRATVATTGQLTLPDAPATGKVLFTNLTDVTVTIPAGTVVLASGGQRFTTDQTVRTPAETGSVVEAAITAVQPGSQGNLPAGSIQSIEGALGLQLTVTNPAPTSGGSDQTFSAPSPLDRTRARLKLLQSLQETAAAEIQAQLAPGDFLLDPTPTLLTILQETYTPAETLPSDVLEIALQLEFRSLALTHPDLERLAQTVLNANLEPGFEPAPDTLTFQLLTEPAFDTAQTARWEMQAERQIVAALPEWEAAALALGQSPAAVRARLAAALPLAAPPQIQLTPPWWPWMPFLPFQIDVHIEN